MKQKLLFFMAFYETKITVLHGIPVALPALCTKQIQRKG